MRPQIRQFRDGDLGAVVGLCQRHGVVEEAQLGLTVDDLVDLATSPGTETLLAERRGEVVGLAIGSAVGTVGTVHRVLGDQVMAVLLEELETRLAQRGATAITISAGAGSQLDEVVADRGYDALPDTTVRRRQLAPRGRQLDELGGRSIEPGLWDELAGMQDVKDVIERRIILPLAEPELAIRHGVAAPQSVVLFGPPGTGKTTFAKGVASRLAWPFVPVEISQLTDEEDGPAYLADTFDRLLSAPAAVAFFDEVEDLAADRQSERRVSTRVTNEFLRQLPRIRESTDHLLVCATNAVGDLDAAFLRPGRFDYILPVGPPNEEARAAIWQAYASDITDEEVDVAALVDASVRFTPADIEFAARKAAQFAFEAEHAGDSDHRATTRQFLAAIEQTRPTLTDDMVASFERDVDDYARF